MRAGTLALLENPVTEPVESFSKGGYTAIDVEATQTTTDGRRIQYGRAATRVEGTERSVAVNGTDIIAESAPTMEMAYSEWVADVTGDGWVVASSTHTGSDPPFPFDAFESATGEWVYPARLNPAEFIKRVQDDRPLDVWMAGTKHVKEGDQPNDVKIAYGEDAFKKDVMRAGMGLGFETTALGRSVRGVLYQGGYVSIYPPSAWGPEQFAAFVAEELLPIAEAVESEAGDQSTLDDVGAEGGTS